MTPTDVIIAAQPSTSVAFLSLDSRDVLLRGVQAPTYIDAWVTDALEIWMTDDGFVWAGTT